MLKKIPLTLQLLFVIFLTLILSNFASPNFVRGAYTFSLFFKDILAFCIPFIVFSFIVTAIISFEHKASKVLGLMLGLIFCSNILATLCAYTIGRFFLLTVSGSHITDVMPSQSIEPFFRLPLPTLIKPELALLAAIIVGLLFPFIHSKKLEHAIKSFKHLVEIGLKKILIPFLPLYVFGFLLKILHEGSFGYLFNHYGFAVILIVISQTLYLLFLYAVAYQFSWSGMLNGIKNTLPSYITGFSTMSSAVTIPVSIECSLKNVNNQSLVHLAIPIMANVHLSGAAFSAPLLTLFTVMIYKGFIPGFFVFLPFAFYFCTTLFAVSGIPAGAIIVVMPLLISQFGFTPEMVSVITTVYCLLDPFGTAANVMGDGALVIILNNILKKLKIA